MSKRIDLQSAPAYVRYPIAIAVVVLVVWLAYAFGGADRPAPGWITSRLIPALAILWAVTFCCVAVRWCWRRWGSKGKRKQD